MKVVTSWDQIAIHHSRRLAQYGGRMYNLHEDIRYTVTSPSPCTVVLAELKPTLAESQAVVIENINCDFALGDNTILLQKPADAKKASATKKPAERYFLVAEDGPPDKILIKKDALVIGRHNSCDIVISNLQVSRRHCLVQAVDGKLRLRNLESTNGIHINGEWVRDGFVECGDRLTVGGCTFLVHREP